MRLGLPGAARRPPLEVAKRERLLAWAGRGDDVVGGTRAAVYLPQRVPWEQVASAEWDDDESTLRVVEVAPYGDVNPVHTVRLDDVAGAARFLQLVRERVSASIVLQRHVAVRGRLGVRVLGRRAPGGRGQIAWFVEYDDRLDPSDPLVAAVVDRALAAAQADVGSDVGADF